MPCDPYASSPLRSHSSLFVTGALKMHIRRVIIFREPKVDSILRRQLTKEGYRILQKVRLADAIAKDRNDQLPQRDFDYYTKAHLDFLVTRDDLPVFAVEFDGAGHMQDEHAIEKDVIKNRLCKLASLPLLRITSSEIEEDDQLTLLDYMLMRYVAWQKEYPSIVQEIENFAAAIKPGYNPENHAVDLNPSFHFDLRHPFPARTVVVERLWRSHRIAWSMQKPERQQAATCLCDVYLGSMGPAENEQFLKCTQWAVVWRPGDAERVPVFSEEISVSLRSWLPLRTEVPAPDGVLEVLWGKIEGPNTAERAQEIAHQFEVRVESIWCLNLPGISAWDIAKNYAEYLGFRAIERWAKGDQPKE